MPESAQISAKAAICPLLKNVVQPKQATASNMPPSQARSSPQRRTARNQPGMDSAPLTKYSTRNSAICSCVACRRSWAKNNINAAGIALAIPLQTNTASKRRNAISRSGCQMADQGKRADTPCASAATGRGAHHSASQPANNARANTHSMGSAPQATDSALAVTTPISPGPSRQATTWPRCTASPPRRTPQAWWAMTNWLCAKQVSSRPATIQAASACGSCTAGKNSPAKPSNCTKAEPPATHSTPRSGPWYRWSLQRPSRGSAAASSRRTSINKAPTLASGKPKVVA